MLQRRPFFKKGPAGVIIALLLLAITCLSLPAHAQTWSPLFPTGTAPAGRQYHSAVLDPNSNRMIVFGGRRDDSSGTIFYNDVWILNLTTSAWSPLSPIGTPPAGRWLHGTGYDPVTNRMIIFGGSDGSNCLNDVWALSFANGLFGPPTWTQLSPLGSAPGPRSAFISNYDATSNRFIAAGGNNCATWPYQDAYVLSNAHGSAGRPVWTSRSPSGSLPLGSAGEVFGANFYDPSSDRLIFWGFSYPLNKFVVLSNALSGSAAWSSQDLAASPATAASGQTAIYKPSTNRAVFFGGNTAGAKSNELWGLGNANGLTGTPRWVSVSASGLTPPARDGHTAVYDAAGDKMIIFGGNSNIAPPPLNDVWILSDATLFGWTAPVPALSSIAPNAAALGTVVNVTISGADFVNSQTTVEVSGTGVTVGAVTATSHTTLTTTFTISASAAPGPRSVTVTTPSGVSNAVPFTVGVTGPPTFTALSPANGGKGLVSTVTLTGTNFVSGQTSIVVSGTGVTVSSIVVANPTSMTATFDVDSDAAAGTRTVTITTPNGTSSSRQFVIVSAVPMFTSMSPISGSAAAPVNVTFGGANFIAGHTTIAVSGTGVTVGAINVVSTATMTATFTIDTAVVSGVRNVTVTTPYGTTAARTFTIISVAPRILSIAPMSGSAQTPANVIITGSNFVTGQTAVAVSGTGIAISNIQVVNAARVTATFTIEPGAPIGTRQVTVTTPRGASNSRPFIVANAAPSISSISPTVGNATAMVNVTITGSRFMSGQTSVIVAGTGVTVGNVNFINANRVTTTFTIAPGAAAGLRNVTVQTPLGTSNARTFRITTAAPTITSMSPGAGRSTTPVNVIIAGTNFISGNSTVVVSGTGVTVSNVAVVNAARINATFTIAPGAVIGPRDVRIQTHIGTSNARTFTVAQTPPATFVSLSPTSGSALSPTFTVTMAGTNFVPGLTTVAVSGSGVTVGTVTVNSPVSATAQFTIDPTAPATARNVTITTPFGTTNSRVFTVNSAVPALSSLAPNGGSALLPVNVTLAGINFVASGLAVNVSGTGISVGNVVLVNSTTVTATLTIHGSAAVGPRNVTVSTSFGTSGAQTFTVYSAAPVLTSVSPNSGTSAAPVNVTLSGSNFVAPLAVSVSGGTGIAVSNVNVVSSTSATATLTIDPAASAGARNVSIATNFGTTSSVPFTISATAPTLSAISPFEGPRGTTVNVTLTGSQFFAGQTQVIVSGSGIAVSSVNVTSSTTLNAVFTINSGAAAGARNVSVNTLLGTSGNVTFTVKE